MRVGRRGRPGSPTARAGLAYLALRGGAFVVALAVGIIAGLHGLGLLLGAFLVSAVVSWPLARHQRAEFTRRLAGRSTPSRWPRR